MRAPRIVIAGGPRTGKTTMARSMVGRARLYHTDDVMDLGWSEASHFVVDKWMSRNGPWIIEGVAAVRALRKFISYYGDDPVLPPCDTLIWLRTPKVARTLGQERMAKGCEKIFAEILPALQRMRIDIRIEE